ncbi:MAG TPA: DapH/DapD/GlmU-related protein [Fibrobacteraceae bacterium]|nr:DapH/DapD/GlmU-related protein [Fibrobacteraceae bacterium]
MAEDRRTGIHPTALIHHTAIIEDGVVVGPGSKVWHHCHLRRGAHLGANCVLGKGVFIDVDVLIGDRAKIQNGVSVYHGVTLENDVFVGPGVVFTNDRHPRAFGDWQFNPADATLVHEGASICAGACIRCGLEIGPYAMIGMGAVLTHNAGPYELWLGNPARCCGKVDREGRKIDR